jgi:hypothetical protein
VLSPDNAQPRRLLSALIVMLLWLMPCEVILAAEESSRSTPIRQTDVTQAVEALREDPNLATTRQTRTLRWIKDDKQKPKQSSWMKWIGELFRWVAEIGRVFVWVLIALLVGMIILYLLRFTKTFEGRRRDLQSTAPTHVRDLDIRPESLPDDIGAAAWDLWEKGEHRGALSLLYRGLLSRLAHVHLVPIRHSSTEGDCLSLAEKHLSPERHPYIAQLIRTWQRAVYGGEDPPASEMRVLCDRFARALQAPQPESVSS